MLSIAKTRNLIYQPVCFVQTLVQPSCWHQTLHPSLPEAWPTKDELIAMTPHCRTKKKTKKKKLLYKWHILCLTLFSAISFSFASLRLFSTQAAVSSSHGSSSASLFTLLKKTDGHHGISEVLISIDEALSCTGNGNSYPSFWLSRRFSLRAASFSRISFCCLICMGLITSACRGSSFVPSSE